ncbi:MAG: hypothetical protein AUJ98_05100 [Bacteroidetes bacterium CG2_30_33_31]|nr:MAG: hypothetical protein AUJ98_05100 [Bacteroidetes bacterium CG2_30_33_31]
MTITIEEIKVKLLKELPGHKAHKILSPPYRDEEIKKRIDASDIPRNSSVLLLLYQKNGSLNIPFIKRSVYEGVHSGQISLPGGKHENFDVDFKATALREANEEIGIISADVQILGQISDLYIPPSNFRVKVFVGYLPYQPMLIPDKKEVQKIIEIPLVDIFKDDIIKSKVFYVSSYGIERKSPYFDLCGVEIWGATAMIISEFREIILQ